jgi:acyl carrier protein
MEPDDTQRIVFRAIDRVNEVQPDDNVLAKSPATILIGEGGQLDSMGFVNFVAALEEEIAPDFDTGVNIGEELNSRSQRSRASTVGDWIDIVRSLLEPAEGAGRAQVNG